MHVRLSWGKVRPGSWAEYEDACRASLGDNEVGGLIVRYLIQSGEDPDEGWSLSVWDDAQAAARYENGPLFAAVTAPLRQFWVGEFSTRHGEVRVRDELRKK